MTDLERAAVCRARARVAAAAAVAPSLGSYLGLQVGAALAELDAVLAVDRRATGVATWVDRLAFEPEVSDVSPVVRGTWVTVDHIVSLVVDGWSWADILATHPELAEADIRAALAYAAEAEAAN